MKTVVHLQLLTAFTDVSLHHSVVDFPHSIQRHATIQIDGSSHRLKYITKCFRYLDIFFAVLVQTVHLKRQNLNRINVPQFACKI